MYLFGGCVSGRNPAPSNSVYKLDMGDPNEFYWGAIESESPSKPTPRWNHSCSLLPDGKTLLIFGGFGAKVQPRLNDVWLFDTEKEAFSQPNSGKTNENGGVVSFKTEWRNCPVPRGSHSANVINDKLFVFGGYGGSGFTRKDFNDLHALCTKTWEWGVVETTGEKPEERSGHRAVSVQDKLYVMGGWNAMMQFDDMFILDTATCVWSQPASACGPESWGPPRWNFSAVSIFAVPYYKIFVFGGNSGDLEDGKPQGTYLNDVQVLECLPEDPSWTHPDTVGTLPSPRADTEAVYFEDSGKLVIFGGWANRWYGDLQTCKVDDVVGPPYNVNEIESFEWSSAIGPVTGNSKFTIKGEGFSAVNGGAVVRFACLKGFLEVSGQVLNDNELEFETPNFEKFGPVEVEARVKLGQKTLTNASVNFSYFSVTDCFQSLAFGPGLLEGNAAAVPTSFVIQAKDKTGADRVCGMDEFCVTIVELDVVKPLEEVEDEGPDADENEERVDAFVCDNGDGTYTVEYTLPKAGRYEVSIEFMGTFMGVAGAIRGSPFITTAVDDVDESVNVFDGPILMSSITTATKKLKDFSNSSLKALKKQANKEEVKSVTQILDHLRVVAEKTDENEISIDTNMAALSYLKKKGGAVDKLITNLSNASELWADAKKQAPITATQIIPMKRVWTDRTERMIEQYEKVLEKKKDTFKQSLFWKYQDGDKDLGHEAANKLLKDSAKVLKNETTVKNENANQASIFGLESMMKGPESIIAEMLQDIDKMTELWAVAEGLVDYIISSKGQLWSAVDAEALEDGAKGQMKKVKALHKCVRWCDAFKSVDAMCKNFLSTIPLISMLGSKSMRERHWKLLMKATGKTFTPPYEDDQLLLAGILDLNLHEFTNEVEEICDQAVKEEKMEKTLEVLEARWSGIEFNMQPYKDTDVPLLGIGEEDFEALEGDQLTVQGMMASRFLAQFETEVTAWHRALFNVNEVFLLISEIQRTWSYLEPLFIGSDEVKRELPEDAARFATIDMSVKDTLKKAYKIRNIKDAFNEDGLYKKLEGLQEQLEMCKKSLADFLDGRRRQFPRYYFVSEADLLDVLSNGSQPEKILTHVSKIYLSTKTFDLAEEMTANNRPIATRWIAGVGAESCDFEPPVPLEGKVEIYMQTVLDAQKSSIFKTVLRSLDRYQQLDRPDWVLAKDPKTAKPLDPAQTTLLVLAVNYVKEVEDVFASIERDGDLSAMSTYSEKQVEQLGDLIRLTQSNLSKNDRTRVMVCITMDAHGRDIVQNMIRKKVAKMDHFMWQSQLKHKFRKTPSHAKYQNRDPTLRGSGGERAEVAICDAILPYDYEYLGNGGRLVITPLTDRVYVTATQALNLNMGCAPAGPAGTGKTESTKDLANALAKLIYVINCSPEMDYQGLGNIFKGVASSGAWVCFDEFNRLIPEVLSVCTVQFKSVCDGIASNQVRIRVEGDEVTLDPTCGAYITMNPGYLGRSELPEGLKALFRPMTVMVPDLVLICENMLMAEGFVTAKALASKFFCLYSLLKALLSAQLHYDWGLRAIKSVLVVAGSFKRAEPDLPEDALLMRALRDFNIPKIVREDEVVFFGLLGDLFPGIDPPRKLDENFETHVCTACEKLGNDPDDIFRLKVVQTEELLQIRHCVFLMGPAGAGKSQCWRTLQQARNLRDPDMPTRVVDLSPKAVKTEELYGYISLATREWKDGLLSNIMRELSGIPDEKPKWVMLDGDLDANWIESMNSVMDDNRMLTLASNERIPLLPHMKLVFEIRDLKHATPATVSRAGILYISTDDGTQWRSLINSWIKTKNYSDEILNKFRQLFDFYISDTLLWLLINTEAVVPTEDVNRVQVLLWMLDGVLNEKNTESPEALETVFVYCTVWALGSCLTLADDGTDYRKMFSDWWRGEWKQVKFQSRGTVFDYWLDPETNQFDEWKACSKYFYDVDFYSDKMAMTQVTVPTSETASVTYWMNLLVDMRKPVMLSGPAGTGKTQLINGMLNTFDPLEKAFATINFNYYTTSGAMANNMAIPLEKKTGSNYGPIGMAKLIYFVDDINLPEVDNYNTQSAIEHLRQHMEYEHCYELTKMTLKNISKTQVVSCLNPTAGSFVVNPRLQRLFAVFAIGLPGPTSLLTIYQTFLDGHLRNFEDDVKKQANGIIKAAMGLHSDVASTFRKTAANFHYEFNIRHISNVFMGLLVSAAEQFDSAEKIQMLWLHESERVYGDRLVSPEDLAKFNGLAQKHCKKNFPSLNIAKFYAGEGNADPLVFCHFAEGIQDKVYDQVLTLPAMGEVLEGALAEYNESNANMDLVLFADAMKHVARIVRIVLNEGGHALLVGVGGSGKQSLSRLAAFICDYDVMQIVISGTYGVNDLKEDLKLMYNKAGLKEQGVMFLLTDSQIVNERFLIYINDLLASGNIPDLFAGEEIDNIVNAVTNRVKAAGLVPEKKTCWEFFIGEIRKNLHVCLAFSPVGDDFRERARKFPALVNCTVIDWFQPWPKEALFSVGQRFLQGLDLGDNLHTGEKGATRGKVREAIEKFLPFSFEAVNKMTHEFKRVERRYVYTTPKSFLELLKLYNELLERKRAEASASITRLDNGLLKLKDTSEGVAKLEEDLRVMLEDAGIKKETAEAKAEVVGKEKETVDYETGKAEIEANEVAIIQEEVEKKQKSTQEDLEKALPAVENAMAALDSLDVKDLQACKGMQKPPPGVDDIFAATMCLLANVLPSVTVQKNGKVKDRDWGAAKKQCMGDIKAYLEALKGLKPLIDDGTINKINFKETEPYLALEHFDPEIIKGKNQAAAGLCSFVINIVTYYNIVTTVEPKKKALKEANETLAAATTRLSEVNEKVRTLQEKLAALEAELKDANETKQAAEDSVNKGQMKLGLATRLTSALASENERWAINVVKMREDATLLMGDVLLASAFISYIGPFTKPFRVKLMDESFYPFLQKEFQAAAGEDGVVPMSAGSNPLKILTTPAQVAGWNADGLPADVVSMENGSIVENSSRWPLLIDPQLQGINWIRNKEGGADRNLQVVRLGQKDLIRKLELALDRGTTLLIENLGETLEAVLNPVIQRATIKRGSKFFIKVGDKECDFHPDFKLYLHTKLSNPHYPPEIQAETTLVNFTVTIQGLEDQLLDLVVEKERNDLAMLSEELVKQQNGFTIKIKELEDSILSSLAAAEGDITEDVALIEGLEDTKKISEEIAEKQVEAKITQESIKITREKYRGVANRSSLLFFLMNDLVKIHTYYIYSLAAFKKVFFRGIDSVAEKVEEDDEDLEDGEQPVKKEKTDEELAARCVVLLDSITLTTFNYVRRGLFEVDKLTVATMLALKIMVNDGKMKEEDVNYLVMGNISNDPGNMGPLHEWMPETIWPKIKALEGMAAFKGLGDNMQSDSDDWNAWFEEAKAEACKLPGDYEKGLSGFEKLILLRALRPDRVSTALTDFIGQTMGKDYIVQKPFDMASTYSETSSDTPVFFVLFAGVDPTPWVENLGKSMGVSEENKSFMNISMGQGQEPVAESVVTRFAKEGGWVMLQNCHLMSTWVPKLERLLEVVSEDAHENFRCFISAEPPPMPNWKNMPESLMQSCVKVANEAPSDIQSNLIRAWDNFDQAKLDSCDKSDAVKSCLFSLCWFHAVVCGRKKFGQQGWSRKYSFNVGDLIICSNVLVSYLNNNETTPWDDLRYIFGEIMYGGHITDAWDRRTCNTYLKVYQDPGLLTGMEFAPGFKSPNPEALDYDGYITYTESAMPPESPVLFGLHPNAEIGYLTSNTHNLFFKIAAMSGGSGGAGGGAGDVVKDTMENLNERLPEEFGMVELNLKAKPLLAGESGPFIVVACQECGRMNVLIGEIRKTLSDLDKALKGQLNMSQQIEDLITAIGINQWPGRNPFSKCTWEKKAWFSQKNLQAEFNDMLLRIDQLNSWCEELTTPKSIWLPGLFNPSSYLTAVQQVTARKLGKPLDKMTTETHVTTYWDANDIDEYAIDGTYAHGFYLEGARWPRGDDAGDPFEVTGTTCQGSLAESRLKELIPPMPALYVKAVEIQPEWEPSPVGYLRGKEDIFECPVYHTTFRGPTYVFLATLRTEEPTSKWILGAVAIMMQTDD